MGSLRGTPLARLEAARVDQVVPRLAQPSPDVLPNGETPTADRLAQPSDKADRM